MGKRTVASVLLLALAFHAVSAEFSFSFLLPKDMTTALTKTNTSTATSKENSEYICS